MKTGIFVFFMLRALTNNKSKEINRFEDLEKLWCIIYFYIEGNGFRKTFILHIFSPHHT